MFQSYLYATIIAPSYKVLWITNETYLLISVQYRLQGDFSADSIMRHLADITDYIDFR